MSFYSSPSFFNLSDFAHPLLFHHKTPVWMAITRISDYLLSYCLGKISGVVEPGVFLPDPEQIVIGKGTIVESGAYIKGPCIIGENCVIRHGAYLRGGVITGNDCLIGHGTEVKHSIFLNGAKAGHFAYVGDSILGNRVNLGAGTKLANLRFDKKNIFIKDGEKKVDSGLRKLGAILGDGSQTGCNAVTRPGVLIEPKSIFHPSTFLSSRIS